MPSDSTFTLPDDMIASFQVVAEDAFGNKLPGDVGTPVATVSDPELLAATVDDTTDIVDVQSVSGKLGTAQLTVTVTVGDKTLSAIQDIEVVAGSAATLGLQPAGTRPRTDLGGTTPPPEPTP